MRLLERSRLVDLGVVAAMILAPGCAQTGMPRAMRATIPVNTNVVTLIADLAPAAMYASAERLLAERGFQVTAAPRGGLSLTTDARPVGQSHSRIRVALEVTPVGTGSVLRGTGSHAINDTEWLAVALRGDDRRASEGFEELVMLLGQLPHKEIQYESR